MEIRGRATEALGHLALVTKEAPSLDPAAFAGMLPDILRHALVSLQSDSVEMSEFTYGLFSNLSTSLGVHLDPFVSQIVPAILTGLAGDDGVSESIVDRDANGISSDMLQRFGDDEGDVDDMSPGAKVVLNIRTAMLESKAAALYAVGQVCANASPAVLEAHYEAMIETLAIHTEFLHEDVRAAAVKAMPRVVLAIHRGERPDAAAASASVPHGPTIENVLSRIIFPLFTDILKNDTDKVVVSACCTAMQDIIEGIGPSSLASGRVDAAMGVMVGIFQKKVACFMCYDDDDDDDDEEADHDNVLVDALSDCVGAIAKACGKEFTRYLSGIYDPLMRYTRASRPTYDRIMALGLLAEIVQGIEAAVIPFAPKLLTLALQSMQDPSPGVKRNAAFLCGMVMLHGGSATASQARAALTALFPLTNELSGAKKGATSFAYSDRAAIVDNACGAIARIIVGIPAAQLPLAEMLPHYLSHLPLKFDHEEDAVVFRSLAHLSATAWQQVAPHMGRILQIIAMSLTPEAIVELKTDAREVIAKYLRFLGAQHPEETMRAASTLSAEAQQYLQQGMAS